MTARKHCAIAVVGLIISTGTTAPTSAAELGQYFGANIGPSKFNLDESGIANLPSSRNGKITSGTPYLLEDSDTAWSLTYGYKFTRNFSLEASYVDFGESTFSQTAVQDLGLASYAKYAFETAVGIKGLSLVGVAVFPVGNFEFNGNLGFLFALVETSWSGTAKTIPAGTAESAAPEQHFSKSDMDNSIEFLLGVGAGYNISERFHVRVDWTLVQASEEVSALTAGFRYRTN
jgi:hypothetical protein